MKRLDWISVSFGILVYAGFLVFRHVYYNSWLPNTFFAKPQDWIGGRAFPLGGIDYTNIFHHRNGGPLLIPLILLLITKKHAVQGILFVLGVLGCALAFVFYANVDWMSNERFFVPYIGVLYTFALSPLMIRTNLVAVHPLAKTAAVGAIILFFGLDQITRLDQMETSKDTYPLHLMSCVRLDGIGKDLKRRFHGRGVLATKRIGAIPFYSGLRIVDAYGLADKEIARIYYEKPSGQRRRMAVRAAFRRNPTMVLSYTTRRLRHPQKSSSKDAHMFHGLDRYLFEEAMKRKFRFVKEYQSSRTEWAYLFVKRL